MSEMNAAEMAKRQPFFYDVTLRDGNQALPKPWNNAQKKDVYLQLLKLGVHGAEVGFPASSEMDFESCKELAQLTAKMAEEGDEVAQKVVVSGLARCVESDIQRCWEAVQYAPHPRIHTFLATSKLSMEHVLHLTPEQVKEKAVKCVKLAKSLVGDKGDVEKYEPPREKPIDNRALFHAANNKTDKDTLAAQTASKVTESLKAGHPQGNTNIGKTDGTPNAHLQGRTVLGTLPRPTYAVQNSGIVVVTIWVDQYGTVQKAVAGADGTTVTDSALWQEARKAALGAHFNMSADAPALQQGTITYRFNLK